MHILAQTPEWRHWRKLILAHFDKSMSSNLRENTFSAQLILVQRVLCANAAKYNRPPNFLVLHLPDYLPHAKLYPSTDLAQFHGTVWVFSGSFTDFTFFGFPSFSN
jgi:hypothetical protein